MCISRRTSLTATILQYSWKTEGWPMRFDPKPAKFIEERRRHEPVTFGGVNNRHASATETAETLTPTIASDGRWTSGFKGVLMNCPLEVAWDFFSDWGNWRWQISSLICELREGESRNPGSLRFIKYPAWWLNERILEIDNDKHFLSYSIEENNVFGGMKGFLGCIQFQESGDRKTMVEYWKYELEPVENQTPESFCGFVNDHLKGILAELERGAKTHAPGLNPKSRLNQTSAN